MKKSGGKNMKRPYLAITLIIVVCLIAAAAVVWIISSSKSGVVKSASAMPFSIDSEYVCTIDGVLYTDGSTLSFMDFKSDKKNFQKALTKSGFKLLGTQELKVIYDETSMQIIGLDYPVEFSGTVLDVKCSSSYIAVLKREAGNDSILVFDAMGEQTDRFDFSDTSIIGFGFYASSSGEKLYTMTMDLRSSLPETTVTTYDVARKATSGIMTVQSQLVSDICFSSRSIFVVGTENLFRFKEQTGQESYREKIYGYTLYDYSFAGERPLFMLTDGASLRSVRLMSLDEADIADEGIASVQLPDNTIEAFLSNGCLYAVTQYSLIKYSADGVVCGEYAFSSAVASASKLCDGRLLVSDGATTTLLVLE